MSEKKNVKKPLTKELTQTNNSKKPLSLNMDFPSNINVNNRMSSQKKVKNHNFIDIENILKNANKIALKKYSTNLDKKINYIKYKNIQKLEEDNQQKNNNNFIINKTKKILTENTGASTTQNQKVNKAKMYEEIIKKNMPKSNNVYHKYTNRNMSFQLKKDYKANEETIKSPLESIRSRESNKTISKIKLGSNNLDYQKFKNVFLIINDSISISTNTMVKNTNNNFMKFLSFLNNNEILHLFSLNREMRSSIIGCLAYKVKEKILPEIGRAHV